MRAVNAASKSLSAVLETGSKAGSEAKPAADRTTATSVTKHATTARKELGTLRMLDPRQVDVERAASSVVGKLVGLDMYHAALGLLQDMYPFCANQDDAPSPSSTSPLTFLALPIPNVQISDIHLALISAYHLHALAVLSHTTTDRGALASALLDPNSPTILSWSTTFSALPEKQHDHLFTRAYSLTSRLASSTPLPSTAYSLRLFALLCLTCTRPSVIAPSTFWEQAVKFAAMYANAASSGPKENAAHVTTSFARLAARAQVRPDAVEFMAGPAFARFCEYWSRFARQAGDLATLESIGRFAQPAGAASASEEDRKVIEASDLATTLARALAVFEHWQEHASDFASKLSEGSAAIKRCGLILAQSGSDAERVKRGVERLRRASMKALEPSRSDTTNYPPEVKATCRTILQGAVDALCEAITTHNTRTTNLLGPVLEGLFTLARTAFALNNPGTYSTARSLLSRARSLLPSSPLSEGSVSPISAAYYTRCVAAVHYYLAGQLHQSGRYDHAAPFVEEACALGQQALDAYHEVKTSSTPMDVDGEAACKEEHWEQLEEQLFRRWELLGVCHVKTGDRRSAYDAFVRGIKAFPFANHDLVALARKTPIVRLFDSPALKQLGVLIDRVTYVAACELLLPPTAVSALSWFSDAKTSPECNCVYGALIERQIASLEESKWKPGVRDVLRQLVDDALLVYDVEDRPVRHVRLVLKRLELACQPDAGLEASPDERSTELAKDAEQLLARQSFALDASLSQHCPEYLASLHLWRAIYAHRTRDPAVVPAVVAHAEEACKVIRAMVPALPTAAVRASLGGGRATKDLQAAAPAKRATRGAAKAAPRPKIAVTRTRAPPVTPKKRRPLDPNLPVVDVSPPKGGVSVPVQGKMHFEDFDRLVSLIRMVSHLIGLVGHVLVRIQLLNAARRLAERHLGMGSEVYVSLTIDTAHEYVKLGRAEKAVSILAHVLPAARAGSLPQDLVVVLLLRYSESLAAADEVLKASITYCDAVAAASDVLVEEKGLPTAQRIRVRAALLERAAQAALSYAAVQDARDDPTSSIEGLSQALRLWNRAIETISRLQPLAPKEPAEDNPTRDHPRASHGAAYLDSSGWRLAEGLLATLLSLAHAYAARGSAREAEFFAAQTRALATTLHAPVMVSRARALQGELLIQLGQLPEGHVALMEAAALVMHLKGPDAVEVRRLLGRYSQRSADAKGAQQLFEEAAVLLDELSGMFASLDGVVATGGRKSLVVASPRRSLNPQESTNVFCRPRLCSSLIEPLVSLLHESGAEYQSLLERFAKLPQSADAKAEEVALRAKLTLDEVYSRFRADMFLSSLAESAMTIPMGMSGDGGSSPASQDMLETLSTAERLFWEHMGYIARRGHVSSVREAAVCLALIRTFRTSLGRGDEYTPVLAAQLLDASTVTTLRREMLDVVRHKFLNMNAADGLQWPLMTPNGSPLPPPSKAKRVTRWSETSLLDSEDDEPMDVDLKSYWEAVSKRYEAQCFDSERMTHSQCDTLPAHWSVVNISVTEDRQTMFVTRQRAGRRPLIFCLPLRGRREGQEDEHLTYDDVIKELENIINASTEKTREAGSIDKEDKAARQAWWKARTELDGRLRDLLADIEFCWLGAFKTIFDSLQNLHSEDLSAFRSRLESVFQGNLVFQDKKPKSRISLDDGLLECFSALPASCRDEEVEDLVYFILDLYQFHGIPVATSEVDIDQVVVELRSALEEHGSRLRSRGEARTDDDSHLFLVLDKNVQGIPWESLPVLRGKSVSRIPSMDFLVDRLEFSHWRKWEDGSPQEGVVDRAAVDPRKTYFVLNPSADLSGTQARFEPWLKGMKAAGWDGVVGRAPSEQQVVDALTNRDLFIYFGHGGGEQYVRAHKVRHLARCAATMLWGCSSGTLKYMGDLDRTGTPYHYMLAGCPTLVANLWDVTDREIDKVAQSVFDDLALTPSAVGAWRAAGPRRTGAMSVVEAVARARDGCRLKYLTGAAPVVYGIPFYL
ncbi:peptidase family C50-domain-containing protein [Epithele typhae]|uniref:peptidase family C50-domain-containing protein n=1 Tax=Epithele typhae TaxID=378194 RepID=UPI00200744FD|nr:peptidase family C50-domain-containing protein [Epithele typhae]KAH9930403.1 peptidase family C50-domain-containing protein [Epithele typhae]